MKGNRTTNRGHGPARTKEKFSEGQPLIRARVPAAVAAYVASKPPGWLRALVEREMALEASQS